jgi:hypothetical protein
MRLRVLVMLIAGVAVLAGTFGVAAAGEHKQPVISSGDCGCTGGARAKDRVERGLVPGVPASKTTRK